MSDEHDDEFCKEHDRLKSERTHWRGDEKIVERYCYDCENIRLWNLAGSVGR